MPALALLVPLLVAAANDCYLVSNKEIEKIPCNFHPAVIDALLAAMEQPEPTEPQDDARPQSGSQPPRVQARERPQSPSPSAGVQGRTPQRGRDPQAGVQTPERQQLSRDPQGAEAQRSRAQDPGAAQAMPSGREPQQPSTLQPGAAQAVPPSAGSRPSLDATVAELRTLEAALASGSTGDAQAVLARAAQAFAAANVPAGAASITAAQEALARSDLYAARQAIVAAAGAAASR